MAMRSPSATRMETTSALALLSHHRDAVRAVAQRAKAGHVVGVQMRVHRLDQLEVKLSYQLQITIDPLQHRVDDQRFAAVTAGEEIGVGSRRAVEELAEDHGRLPGTRLGQSAYGAAAAAAQPSGLKYLSRDGGNLASAAAGRIGRRMSSPEQFGQRPLSTFSAHPLQNVHSNEQIMASRESGGRSASQHSQLGLSKSMRGSALIETAASRVLVSLSGFLQARNASGCGLTVPAAPRRAAKSRLLLR